MRLTEEGPREHCHKAPASLSSSWPAVIKLYATSRVHRERPALPAA